MVRKNLSQRDNRSLENGGHPGRGRAVPVARTRYDRRALHTAVGTDPITICRAENRCSAELQNRAFSLSRRVDIFFAILDLQIRIKRRWPEEG